MKIAQPTSRIRHRNGKIMLLCMYYCTRRRRRLSRRARISSVCKRHANEWKIVCKQHSKRFIMCFPLVESWHTRHKAIRIKQDLKLTNILHQLLLSLLDARSTVAFVFSSVAFFFFFLFSSICRFRCSFFISLTIKTANCIYRSNCGIKSTVRHDCIV